MSVSRRHFVAGMAAVAASTRLVAQASATCPFHLSVINDEISPDFDHACYVAAHDFGLSYIEIRSLWHTTLAALSDDQIKDMMKILAKYKLKVTDLAVLCSRSIFLVRRSRKRAWKKTVSTRILSISNRMSCWTR